MVLTVEVGKVYVFKDALNQNTHFQEGARLLKATYEPELLRDNDFVFCVGFAIKVKKFQQLEPEQMAVKVINSHGKLGYIKVLLWDNQQLENVFIPAF